MAELRSSSRAKAVTHEQVAAGVVSGRDTTRTTAEPETKPATAATRQATLRKSVETEDVIRPERRGQEGQQGQGRRGRWNFNRAQNVSNSESNWRWHSNKVKVDKGQTKTFSEAVKKKTSFTEAAMPKAYPNLDARVKTKPPRVEVNTVRSEGIKKRSPDIAKSAKQSRNYQPKDKFRPGQQVFVQDQHDKRWTGRAVIIRRGRNQREFIIRMSSGVEQHRNGRSPRLGPSPQHEPIKVAPQRERTSCEGNARPTSSAPIQLRSILKKTGTVQEPPWSQKG